MYPSTKEITVDLNQTYEFKYDFKEYFNHNKIYRLIYSIDKAERDVILQFKYNIFIVYKNSITDNPLKICHGDICQNNITNYEIKKGEFYKIYISINFLEDGSKYIHYLPSFSFNFTEIIPEKPKEEEKKKEDVKKYNLSSVLIACIIIGVILIIGAIGLIIFIIKRKNRKSNNEIINSGLYEFELNDYDEEINY